ncbi:MAG TPA: hypothetical protein VEL76_04285 [Gemmataceae bacterium]|nr:hypothetical protein [Gemmataceae bacterium]
MSAALSDATPSLRIIHRRTVTVTVRIKARRPSLLDPNLQGDPWIQPGRDGTLALCFDAWEMAAVSGVAFDVPALNGWLHHLRHRPPRRRCG